MYTISGYDLSLYTQVQINLDELTVEVPKSLLVKHNSMLKAWLEDDFDKQLDSKGNIVLTVKDVDSRLFASYVIKLLQVDKVEFDNINDAIQCFELADYLSLDAFKIYVAIWINLNEKIIKARCDGYNNIRWIF